MNKSGNKKQPAPAAKRADTAAAILGQKASSSQEASPAPTANSNLATSSPERETSPAPTQLSETAIVSEAAVAPRTEDVRDKTSQDEGAVVKKSLFLDHPVLNEVQQENPASLKTNSWRYPITSRETDVRNALSSVDISAVKQSLDSGDLGKVINQHLGEFIEKLKLTKTTDIKSLEELLEIALKEMRATSSILRLCKEFPSKNAEKIAALNNVIGNVPDNLQAKANEELNALKNCATARPQDRVLMLALKTLSATRMLQLEKLKQRMQQGFDELREIQSGIDLAYEMMPDEVKKALPDGLVVHTKHDNDYIYDQIMKK